MLGKAVVSQGNQVIITVMDFKGQEFAEQIFHWLLILFGAIAFAIGWLRQDFALTVYVLGAGVLLTCAVCLPDWSFFNRHPIDFNTPKKGKLTVSQS